MRAASKNTHTYHFPPLHCQSRLISFRHCIRNSHCMFYLFSLSISPNTRPWLITTAVIVPHREKTATENPLTFGETFIRFQLKIVFLKGILKKNKKNGPCGREKDEKRTILSRIKKGYPLPRNGQPFQYGAADILTPEFLLLRRCGGIGSRFGHGLDDSIQRRRSNRTLGRWRLDLWCCRWFWRFYRRRGSRWRCWAWHVNSQHPSEDIFRGRCKVLVIDDRCGWAEGQGVELFFIAEHRRCHTALLRFRFRRYWRAFCGGWQNEKSHLR